MTVHAIHHINLRASAAEIRKLRDFYCDVIGLTEGLRPPFNSSGFWLYAGDDPIVHLVQLPDGETSIQGPRRGSGFDHVAFRCSDLKSMLTRLGAHGVRYAINEVALTQQTQVVVQDPVGIKIELNFDAAALE